MKVIYQADDGKIFDNEVECRTYEKSTKICEAISKKRVRILTYNKKVMEEKDCLNYKGFASLMDDVYYFRCNDKEVLEILSDYFAEDFEEDVIYFYDNENEGWRELDSVVNNYKLCINDLLKVKETIMNRITA